MAGLITVPPGKLVNVIYGLILTNLVAIAVIGFGFSKRGLFSDTGCPPTPCPRNCYDPICAMSPPFSTDAAYQMVRNYRENHWMILNNYCNTFKRTGTLVGTTPLEILVNNDGLGNPIPNDDPNIISDARSAWYNLDTLKAFINTIETMVCSKKDSCDKFNLGIRIYYAEYPRDSISLDTLYGIQDQQYLGMHTLLMIPTYSKSVGGTIKEVDFDPYDLARIPGTCDFRGDFDCKQPILALPPNAKINARNHGGLIPPPFRYNDDWNTISSGAAFMRFVDVTNDYLNFSSVVTTPYKNRKK